MPSTEHVRWIDRPELRHPAVVAAFTGWNDAGEAASGAVQHLVERWGARALAEIDPEEFTDFATVRPHVRLTEDRTRHIVWPTVGLWCVSTPGADVILVLGPEPALRWRLFTDQIVGVAEAYRASMVLTLGALLADVPHRSHVQVIGTASDQAMIDRYDLQRSRYEGPTGIVGVLHQACTSAGLASASLWAAVPAYASQVPSPKAAAALIERAATLVGSPAPLAELLAEVDEYETRVDSLVDDDEDLAGYVRRLETMSDDDDDDDRELADYNADYAVDDDDLDADEDSGDERSLMDEIEGFLRDQRDGHGD